MRECDVPVPPCSAFRLLSSLSYSHALPCYIYRAAQQDAWRSKRGVAFASNDYSKCFDRMQLGIQLLLIRLLYQPNADDTSQMHQLHSELMRCSTFRVRLPGCMPAVGPPCHVTQSASQGTSTGCDRANDFGETVGRAASRGFRDATNYTYSSAPPDGSKDQLNQPGTGSALQRRRQHRGG